MPNSETAIPTRKPTGGALTPIDWTPNLVHKITRAITKHGSIFRACIEESGLPDRSTIYLKAEDEDEAGEALRHSLARARKAAGHLHAEKGVVEAEDLAARATSEDPEVAGRVTHQAVSAVASLGKYRQWLASKWAQGTYGDKMQVESRSLELVAFVDLNDVAKARASLEADTEDGSPPALPWVAGPDGRGEAPAEEDA